MRPGFDLGLNQMDIRGSAAGLFEGGRRMLMVHHWRSWFQVDVARLELWRKLADLNACFRDGYFLGRTC